MAYRAPQHLASAHFSRSISHLSPLSSLHTSCIGLCSIPSKHCSSHPRTVVSVHNVLLWFLPPFGKLTTIHPLDFSSNITFSKIACQEILRNSRYRQLIFVPKKIKITTTTTLVEVLQKGWISYCTDYVPICNTVRTFLVLFVSSKGTLYLSS